MAQDQFWQTMDRQEKSLGSAPGGLSPSLSAKTAIEMHAWKA
jgi:hypothetical protein